LRFLPDNNAIEVILDHGLIITFIVKNFLATLVLFEILSHFFNIVEKIIQSGLKSLLIAFLLCLEQLNEFEIVIFGVVLGLSHCFKVSLFVGGIEISYLFFDFLFVELPCIVNIHLN
jgi:hypothetical protein